MGTSRSRYDGGARADVTPRRRRQQRQRRARGALTSLVILFIFVLGQASLIAVASELDPQPVATDGTDSTTADLAGRLDEATSQDAASADPATDETTTNETAAVDATEDATTESSDDTAEATVAGSVQATGGGSDTPGPPSGDGVQPTVVPGNPTCLDVMGSGTFLFEHKQDPPQDATIELTHGDLTGTLTIVVNETAQTIDFSFTGDFVAAAVLVKGGPNANFYDYRPAGNAADTGLHAPVNPNNGMFYGLSHLSFCIVEGGGTQPTPGIDVEKSCPATVEFGADIEYTITVENTGDEPLVDVMVDDTLLGDITGDFDVDLSAGLAVGVTATAVVTYSPGPDEDTVTNTVTATGTGADSDVTDSDTATCETDVTPPPPPSPAIQIVKDGPAMVHVGDTITYEFEVTNVGDMELFDVELSDPTCDAGTIVPGADVDSSLAVDEVWHFTCTHLVTAADPDPLPNTATVSGDTEEGEGGEEVTDTDDHVVDIIHPGIAIVKTVSDSTVDVGATVTYTYVVTNTGDTTLFNVSVDDNVLGHIGTIASLEAGASVTLTATFTVGSQPVINIGTATGEDVLGGHVTDIDDASVTPIAGTGGGGPGPGEGPDCCAGAGTAFTGSETGRWALLAGALTLIGLIVLTATRRKAEGASG